jgi:hypothetical protein
MPSSRSPATTVSSAAFGCIDGGSSCFPPADSRQGASLGLAGALQRRLLPSVSSGSGSMNRLDWDHAVFNTASVPLWDKLFEKVDVTPWHCLSSPDSDWRSASQWRTGRTLIVNNFSTLDEKRVTGLEPATFSFGSFSIDWLNRLCHCESHTPSGLDVRRSVRGFWPSPLL